MMPRVLIQGFGKSEEEDPIGLGFNEPLAVLLSRQIDDQLVTHIRPCYFIVL